MYSSRCLITTLAIASTVIAAPLNEISERAATFTVHQTLNLGFKGFYSSGQAALAKAYAKYGVTMPEEVSEAVAAAAAASTGTVAATPEQYDSEYLCPVSIGTPAQVLNLDFDTGSADLWVFSSQTPKSEVDGQRVYSPGSSSTSKLLSGYTWSITYGDGSSSSGDVYDDVVSVGGVSYATQAVESAETVSDEFTSDSDSDGLLGLAFSSINTVKPTKQKTFFDNVKASLASPVFTADLKYHASGTYDFGFIDSSKYTGSISYATAKTTNGFWEITGSGYAVGSGSFVSTSIDAIADTGTTLLLLPQSVVSAYYAKVSGAKNSNTYGGYVFPCSATLPSFTFGVGSYRGTIPGKYMNYAPASSSGTTCYGGIQSNAGIGFSIFGDILLKAQFVVFDGGATRVGFAAKPL